MSTKISRDDIARVFNKPSLTLEQKHDLVKNQLSITDIDPALDGDALVDAIYDHYLKTAADLETRKKEVATVKKTSTKSGSTRSAGGPTRKSQITDMIKTAGTITLKALVEQADVALGYDTRGKSSRTRVTRVVKDLMKDGAVEEVNDNIVWKG